MKLAIETIKIGLCTSFFTGFTLGMIPNKVSLKFNGKQKFYNINLPLAGGCLGILGFVSAPFLITNYFLDGVYLDKLYDKYNIDVKRYHQFDGTDNKYAFPSNIHIEINKKNEICNKINFD
jgi:hypothetical protein